MVTRPTKMPTPHAAHTVPPWSLQCRLLPAVRGGHSRVQQRRPGGHGACQIAAPLSSLPAEQHVNPRPGCRRMLAGDMEDSVEHEGGGGEVAMLGEIVRQAVISCRTVRRPWWESADRGFRAQCVRKALRATRSHPRLMPRCYNLPGTGSTPARLHRLAVQPVCRWRGSRLALPVVAGHDALRVRVGSQSDEACFCCFGERDDATVIALPPSDQVDDRVQRVTQAPLSQPKC